MNIDSDCNVARAVEGSNEGESISAGSEEVVSVVVVVALRP